MCGKFTTLTWDETLEVARCIETRTPLNLLPDWPAAPNDARPGATVPVIIADDGGTMAVSCAQPWCKPTLRRMVWGFENPNARRDRNGDPVDGKGTKPIFNTRFETAAQSPFWADSFAMRHCIIAARAFYETHRSEQAIGPTGRPVKQAYRFSRADNLPILMAGIWQGDRFSILTREPDEIVGAVHDRMPVTTNVEEARLWLSGDAQLNALQPSRFVREPVYATAESSGQLSLF